MYLAKSFTTLSLLFLSSCSASIRGISTSNHHSRYLKLEKHSRPNGDSRRDRKLHKSSSGDKAETATTIRDGKSSSSNDTTIIRDGDCEICSRNNKDSKPTSLTIQYRSNGQNSYYQDSTKATCAEGTYPSSTTISVDGFGDFDVSDGDTFVLNGKFGAETSFEIKDSTSCVFHTSCSVPLVAGDQIGPFLIVGSDDVCDDVEPPTPGGEEENGSCVICDQDNKLRPESLTIRYHTNGANSMYQNENKASCRSGIYPDQTILAAEGQSFRVSNGDIFTLYPDGDRFDAETVFEWTGEAEDCYIHTSCSVPLVVGDRIGPFEIMAGNDCVVASETPSSRPSQSRNEIATTMPTPGPTPGPSPGPTPGPSPEPTPGPSPGPTAEPTPGPTPGPSPGPTPGPTQEPTNGPSVTPSEPPSRPRIEIMTDHPSSSPTVMPTPGPTPGPSTGPTPGPTPGPSPGPTPEPTSRPSAAPTKVPSALPSSVPSDTPTDHPSSSPTIKASTMPSSGPSATPSALPSGVPSGTPTDHPSSSPTITSSTVPSSEPTSDPSATPTKVPSALPSSVPSDAPTDQPSSSPTIQSSTTPSSEPTSGPSAAPTKVPTALPSSVPSSSPTIKSSTEPSSEPTSEPSAAPTEVPSNSPSNAPSVTPSNQPSVEPTAKPSMMPSSEPTSEPSATPTAVPTDLPSNSPSGTPTKPPSEQPSSVPSLEPSQAPSDSCVRAQVRRVTPDKVVVDVDFSYDDKGPVPSDWVGLYPCDDANLSPPFSKEPAIWAFTCYNRNCRNDPISTATGVGSFTFDDATVPSFGSQGIYKDLDDIMHNQPGCYVVLLNRIEGESAPPYYNVCVGNEIELPASTITPGPSPGPSPGPTPGPTPEPTPGTRYY